MTTAVEGAGFSPAFVCFSAPLSQKPMQLGSPKLTQKCSAMIAGNPFILQSKVEGNEAQKTVPAWDSFAFL